VARLAHRDVAFVAGAAGLDPAAVTLAQVTLALVVLAGPEIGHLGLAVLALVVLALVVLAGPEIEHLGDFQCHCLQQKIICEQS